MLIKYSRSFLKIHISMNSEILLIHGIDFDFILLYTLTSFYSIIYLTLSDPKISEHVTYFNGQTPSGTFEINKKFVLSMQVYRTREMMIWWVILLFKFVSAADLFKRFGVIEGKFLNIDFISSPAKQLHNKV